MSLYYLDPNDEPRECRGCPACLNLDADPHDARHGICSSEWCHGTGRLGNPEAAKVRIVSNEAGWFALGRNGFSMGNQVGPYPTEVAALEAAREAWTSR